MRICVDYALIGTNLDLERNICISIENNRISQITGYTSTSPDVYIPSSIAIPITANCHAHCLDAALPSIGEDLELELVVSPRRGIKYAEISRCSIDKLTECAKLYLAHAFRQGVIVVASYAELESLGVEVLARASSSIPVIVVPFPQPCPSDISSVEKYLAILKTMRRLGMNTLLDLEFEDLKELAKAAQHLSAHIHVHVSETERLYRAKDFERALELKPRAAIHCTYLGKEEALELSRVGIWIVPCPRSNTFLVGRVMDPNVFVEVFLETKRIALGTDNAAWFTPSVLREIEHYYMVSRVIARDRMLFVKALLYAATIGCFRCLGIEYRGIYENENAAMLIVQVPELRYSYSPLHTLVERLSSSRVIAVFGENIVPLETVSMHTPIKGVEKIRRSFEQSLQ